MIEGMGRCRKLYAAVVVVLAAIVLQDILLLLNSILGVNAIFAVYIFFTDLADSMFMVGCLPLVYCRLAFIPFDQG